jgi:hypothetical protein
VFVGEDRGDKFFPNFPNFTNFSYSNSGGNSLILCGSLQARVRIRIRQPSSSGSFREKPRFPDTSRACPRIPKAPLGEHRTHHTNVHTKKARDAKLLHFLFTLSLWGFKRQHAPTRAPPGVHLHLRVEFKHFCPFLPTASAFFIIRVCISPSSSLKDTRVHPHHPIAL